MLTSVLLGAVLVALIVLIVLVSRRRVRPADIREGLADIWRESAIDKTVGEIRTYAQDIRNDYRALEQMLRIPRERADIGEIGLETILGDQLPPDIFGIRQRLPELDGKIPDASIRSVNGTICIDSKFPLENYGRMAQAPEAAEKKAFKTAFIRDVRVHLDKIAGDYVCPSKGSADFAFAYIPAESVYYFLVTEAYDLLREYAGKGVQVVSPLTLSHNIALINAGVRARKLSENAEKVMANLDTLGARFQDIDRLWRVFFTTHFKNLRDKAEELDSAYQKLRAEFDRIKKMPGEE